VKMHPLPNPLPSRERGLVLAGAGNTSMGRDTILPPLAGGS
jgi:hypothetical protein